MTVRSRQQHLHLKKNNMISTAIDATRVSRVVGYKLKKGNFTPVTPYLPQRIVVLGEANTANQVGLSTDPYEFITAKEVADQYGYGSPLHQVARILRPISGDPLGGIPTLVYPQVSDGGATAAVYQLGVTVATTVTANATHKLTINGRDSIDGVSYSFNVAVGDDAAAVRQSIIDAVSNVLSSPVTAAENVTNVDFTTKWTGETATLSIEVDVQGESAGIVYAEVGNTAGTGVVTIPIDIFGEEWNTLVINPYGESQFATLEQINGVTGVDNPTGRYEATLWKPFVALYGDTESDKDNIVTVTNAAARRDQMTNVLCPAPNSKATPWEAAANMCMTFAPTAQNAPHLDNSNKSYPDMPVPSNGDIGDFSDYNARDFMVKKGASTVNLVAGKYTVQDFITTYAPDGVAVPKFRFVRDLNVDWNYAFNWIIIMERDIQDKTIVTDDSPATVGDTISPAQANQLKRSHIVNMARLALIADVEFSFDSIQTGINESNPARLDIFNRYKRTSTAHNVSADAEVDFNYTS
jgi:phage tail sheath gpL-like